MKKRSAALSDSDSVRMNTEQLQSSGLESIGLGFTESIENIPYQDPKLKINELNVADLYRDMAWEILQILNVSDYSLNLIEQVLAIIKGKIGFDAVAIRLQDGDDFPYFAQHGFSKDFLLNENSLLEFSSGSKVCRDSNGKASLGCMCGMVISGANVGSKSNHSVGGSWWTNNLSMQRDIASENRVLMRESGSCVKFEYESIALIPIRDKGRTLGLLQINDRRIGRFDQNIIQILEGIALHIGAALMRRRTEEALRNSEERLRSITSNASVIIIELNREGIITYISRVLPGFKIEDIIGKSYSNWTLPEYHELMYQALECVFVEGTPQSYRVRGFGANGEIRWYQTDLSPVKYGDLVQNVILIANDITDNVLAENSIKESEHRRLTVLETAMDGFWLIDRKGNLLEVNETYCKMSGYSQSELLSMYVSDLEVNENGINLLGHIETIIQHGVHRFESKHKRKDGSILEVEVSAQLQHAREDQINVFLHDISKRKRAEEYLRQSEERYKSLFQENKSAILLIDPVNGEIKDANPAACEYYGWTQSEIVQKNIAEINTLPPTDIAKNLYDSKNGINNHLFFQHRLANGEIRSVEVYSGPIMFSDTTLLYSIIHDVTKSKHAQDELLQSETKFRKYVDHSPHGIFVANERGQYTEVNAAACNITGYSKEELLSKNLIELIPPEWEDHAHNHFNQVLTEGFATGESAFIKKDGTKRYWSVDAVKISNKVFLGFVVDITDRKEIEEVLLKNERLLRESQTAAHIGSYSADLISKTWTASSEVYDIFGIDETYPQTLEAWEMRIHHDFRKELSEELFKDENRKNLFEHEYKIIRESDGEHRWIHGIGEYEYNDKGIAVRLVGTIRDITRKKENEEALKLSNEKIRESENDLNKAESVAHLGHWKWNLTTGEITWSDEMFRIFGIEKDTYTGRLGNVISKMIHPEDLHLLLPGNAINLANSSPIEYRIIMPDQSIKYIAAESGESIFDSEGNPVFFTGIAQDITSRKESEISLKNLNEELEYRVNERTSELLKLNNILKDAEEKYRTVADHTHSWEFWLDKDDNFIYCSPSCERITGFKASEFLNNQRRLLEIIYPDDLKSFINHKKTEDLCQIGFHEYQYRIIRADGAIRWIGHECQPIYDESGNFNGIRGSNRDITERKNMEHLIKTSNQKYKLLSENISDGIFICREGTFEYVNQAMNTIFGYEGSEMEGLKITQLVLPDYLDELEFINAIKFPTNQVRSIEIECSKKDNTTVFIEFKFNFFAKERLLYGVAHDITEKKQIQKNIVKAIIQTEEKERSNFSKELHDGLGPLLSTIKLYLQWSERPKTNKSREEIIHKAEEILEDALITVKEISNRLSPHLLTYYGLNSAIQSFIGKLEETSKIKIEFESNVDRRFNIEIEAALYRALIECINNTIKHSFAQHITIMLNDTGEQIQVHYKDDGVGFEMMETYTSHKGLGLFNLQNRIQTIGGRITLYSSPGKGVDYQIIVNV